MRRSNLQVVVLDDHEIFRRGLRTCLEEDPGIEVHGDESNFETLHVDVVVSSLSRMSTTPPELPIVLCCDQVPVGLTVKERRVSAILPRHMLQPEQLLAAVRAAASGLRVVVNAEAPTTLDGRSLSVLKLLAAGRGTREISQQLGYSERTIKSIIAGVQQALGTHTRAHCVAEALRRLII